MKVLNISNSANRSAEKTNNKKNLNKNSNSNNSPNFKGATDLMIKFWEGVDRGGLAASFTVQDMLGTNIPRTWAAKDVGKEYTGKNNWTAVLENGLREFLTGPSMFAVPAAVLYGTMKYAGKANGVPVESIKDLSDIVGQNAQALDISSIDGFKKSLYREVLQSTFSNFDSQNNLDLDTYVDEIIKMEKAPKKGLMNSIMGKSNPDSKEEIMQGIVCRFVKDKKANTVGYPDFLTGKIAKNSSEIPFEDLIGRMGKFSDDFYSTFVKTSKDSISQEFIDNFAHKRMGGRFLTNIAMGVFTAAAMWAIPRIYTIGKTNPETDPVRKKASELKGGATQQDKPAQGEVNFKGGSISRFVSDLGQKVQPGLDTKLSKTIAPNVESDWINVARPIFLGLITTCTLIPRVIQSAKRDIESSKKNGGPVQWDETSNILRRDVTTIITILFAMKGLGSIMAHNASKRSGIVLTNKVLDDKTNPFKKFVEFFNSEGGVKVLSKKQNTAQMSSFANGDELARFFTSTEAQKGNLHKILNIDANAKGDKTPVLFNAAKKLFGEELVKKEGVSAQELNDVLKAKADSQELKDFLAILNDTKNNPLLGFANKINAIFETVSLALVTGFLGFGLPKINELIIKRKYLKDNNTLQAKYQDPNVQIPAYNLLHNLKPMEKQAFQYFLGNMK